MKHQVAGNFHRHFKITHVTILEDNFSLAEYKKKSDLRYHCFKIVNLVILFSCRIVFCYFRIVNTSFLLDSVTTHWTQFPSRPCSVRGFRSPKESKKNHQISRLQLLKADSVWKIRGMIACTETTSEVG